MFVEAIMEEIWNRLQLAAHAGGADKDYRQLQAILKNGWQIYEPVHLRRQTGSVLGYTYLFTVGHPAMRSHRILNVTPTPDVEQFLHQSKLHIVACDGAA